MTRTRLTTLCLALGCWLNPSPARAAICDDYTYVSLTASQTPVSEFGGTSAQLIFMRSGPAQTVRVALGLLGSAENGVDFAALPSEVVIPSGETQATLNVIPIPDSITEGTETLTVQIAVAPGQACVSVSGPDSVTLSIVEGASLSLATALDAPNLVWTTGGINPWQGQTVVTHNGTDAAESGTIDHSQESWLQTTVTGPGILSFWWKVSSEMDYDFLEFAIGGVVQARVSGEEDWHQLSFAVPSGSRTLRWRYFKDFGTTLGQDRAWVDQVAFKAHSGAPEIVAQPGAQTVGQHDTAAFTVGVAGEQPLSYQWFRNETSPIAGATGAVMTLADVDLADAGGYSVVISNNAGIVTSSVAALTVTTNGTVETILLFVEAATGSPYETALANLGRSFQRITSADAFHLAVTQADVSRTLVVVDPLLGNYNFSAVAHFADRGGRVLLQYWGMDVGSPLPQAFDANVIQMLSEAQPLYDWGGSPFFAGVASPINLEDLYTFDGQTLEPHSGALAVGGRTHAPAANQAALIIGNSGRTILNGFLAETASPTTIPLIEDELRWLLDLATPRAPFITSQPQDQSVTVDSDVTFLVGAGGSFPLSYQWWVAGTTPVAGATDPRLTLPAVQMADAENYRVVVSNAHGSVTSSPAALTVTTSLPVPTTLLFADYRLTSPYEPALVARGYPYQKFASESSFNSAIAAADPSTTLVVVDGINGYYTFPPLPGFVSQGGRAILQYWDLRSGSSLATAFQVSVGPALTTPVPVYDWGGSTFFEGLSTPLMFIDYFNRDGLRLQPMAGAQAVAGFGSRTPVVNQAAVVIGNSGRTLAHGMWLEVVGSFNDAVRLAQNELDFLIAPLPPRKPFITAQPVASRAVAGHIARLAVTAGGSLPLSYQWHKEGLAISQATNAEYLILSSQLEDSGSYEVVVSNAQGIVTSSAANLVVSAMGPFANAVLFRDGPNASAYGAALSNLGIPFQESANDAAFNTALAAADPTRTLVVVDATWEFHYLSPLDHFVRAGGRAILQDWTLSQGESLATLFEVEVGQPFYGPRPVYDWGGSSLFDGLASPLSFTDRFNLAGKLMEPAVGAQAVAGYTTSPAGSQAAIVVGNAGRTIVNGFVLEEITLFAHGVGLAQNEIEYLSPRPPTISSQPEDQGAFAGSNATFTVVASGSQPLRYQWFFDETSVLATATNAALTVLNLQPEHFGTYSVLVSNGHGSVTSRLARLELLVRPVIIQAPLSQSVVEGGEVTFSVEITGSPAPFTYQWRRGSVPLATIPSDARVEFYTVTNVQPNQGGTYGVFIANPAVPTMSGTSPNATWILTVLADHDGDRLPDSWEAAHGFNTNDVTDAEQDADGDGVTNGDEYRADTNPTNALDYLKIDHLTATGLATITFQAVSNKTYTVEYTGDFSTGTWSRLADVLARATNRVEAIHDPASTAQRYYRLITPRR